MHFLRANAYYSCGLIARTHRNGGTPMLDFAYLCLIVGFFAITISLADYLKTLRSQA
jgi:hypothetical protein